MNCYNLTGEFLYWNQIKTDLEPAVYVRKTPSQLEVIWGKTRHISDPQMILGKTRHISDPQMILGKTRHIADHQIWKTRHSSNCQMWEMMNETFTVLNEIMCCGYVHCEFFALPAAMGSRALCANVQDDFWIAKKTYWNILKQIFWNNLIFFRMDYKLTAMALDIKANLPYIPMKVLDEDEEMFYMSTHFATSKSIIALQ